MLHYVNLGLVPLLCLSSGSTHTTNLAGFKVVAGVDLLLSTKVRVSYHC